MLTVVSAADETIFEDKEKITVKRTDIENAKGPRRNDGKHISIDERLK